VPKKPLILEEIVWIEDNNLRMAVQHLLNKYPDYLKQPASISGKYHKGENRLTHIRMTLIILNMICKEFNIIGLRRDRLFTAMILHDIGYVDFVRPGNIKGWKYYPQTGWSRNYVDDDHPLRGFQIVMSESLISEEHKVDIANMILKHMSIWNKFCPEPETEDEKWIAISDYIASRQEIKFVGLEVEDWIGDKNEQGRNNYEEKDTRS